MDLYRVLTTRDCTVCGAFFGGFLFLPSATRCCFPCFRTAEELRMLGTATFCKVTDVKMGEARPHIQEATLRTVPGRYVERPKHLIAVKEALEALTAHGVAFQQPPREPEILTAADARRSDALRKRHMACTALPWRGADAAQSESGVFCKGCFRGHVLRGMRERDRAPRERMFSLEGLLAHFTECGDAKAMWAESRNRHTPPPNMV
ncbi:Cryptococcal mannosyltransferase 1 family protein [Apiospora aurea]|uniref:Cryptococcal mannosyltransferase 1 family protein n=1 Tax=Apiospora aurea TaxID=335848 RepID=A0ABR1PXA4_9PEZI